MKIYGIESVVNRVNEKVKNVCINCGQEEPKLLYLYSVIKGNEARQICRCGNCGRYVSVVSECVRNNELQTMEP